MKITFKTMRNGNKRWFLKDGNGKTIAKFYQQPTSEFCDILSSYDTYVAARAYRSKVNARCDDKNIARVYV